MDNFLIIRLSSLGDVIHTLPAFSALRKNFPEAKISWLVGKKGAEILSLVPGIDRIITVQLKKWPPLSKKFWRDFFQLKRKIKNKNQIALDFQGLIKSAFLTYISSARRRIGFHRNNLKEPFASWFYTETLDKIPEDTHIVQKNLKLLSLLGIHEEKYEFPICFPDYLLDKTKKILSKAGYNQPKKLILFNIGATWETKRWFTENWIILIEKIKSKRFFPLILWGNEEEKKIAEKIHLESNAPLVPLLSLKEVMALIKEAALVVSGDSFALQAACALSRPVVSIFGPTNPKRNGPFNPRDMVAFHKLGCSYCYKRKCHYLECLKKITPEEVANLISKSLEENSEYEN